MGGLKTTTLVGIAIILAIVSALMLSFIQNSKQERLYTITNFDECVAAGYPIMESDPPQCATPDGRIFISGSQVHLLPPVSSENGNSTICVVAGCSGQLCVSAEEAGDIVTTCEYRAEYACYGEASCEPQANGKCGWTETTELKQCLANPPVLDGTPE